MTKAKDSTVQWDLIKYPRRTLEVVICALPALGFVYLLPSDHWFWYTVLLLFSYFFVYVYKHAIVGVGLTFVCTAVAYLYFQNWMYAEAYMSLAILAYVVYVIADKDP
jgi:hypothetical protein